MATKAKNKDNEPPAAPEEDLKLNLTFASTEDLIAEILRRHNPGIVIFTKTDRREEDDSTPEFATLNGGEGCTSTSYKSTGMYSTVLGMLEIVRSSLLRDYFEGS